MSILNYLSLDEKQKAKAEAWLNSLPKRYLEDEELDVSMSGREITLHYYIDGLGDVLYLQTGPDNICHLGYDDDGKLL